MTFALFIEQEQVAKINGFDEKSRRIIRAKLEALGENPYPGKHGDKENVCLKDGYAWTAKGGYYPNTNCYCVISEKKIVRGLSRSSYEVLQ